MDEDEPEAHPKPKKKRKANKPTPDVVIPEQPEQPSSRPLYISQTVHNVFTVLFLSKTIVAIVSVVQIIRMPSHWIQWLAAFIVGEWALGNATSTVQYSGVLPE